MDYMGSFFNNNHLVYGLQTQLRKQKIKDE